MSSVQIGRLTVENHHSGFAISSPLPRLSWSFQSADVKGWRQTGYEISIIRSGQEETWNQSSSENLYVPWPSTPLRSREVAQVRVRVTGADELVTDWVSLTIEAALFQRDDWAAKLISAPPQEPSIPKTPFRLRKSFHYEGGKARLYATAHGIYQVEINGVVVGDQLLTPGWQSYNHRLHYQTYDVTSYLKSGGNTIGAYVGEGWYAGRLGRPGTSNIWGSRLAFLGQLEVAGKPLVITDGSWEYLDGPVTHAEIYNGETFDTNLDDPTWSTAQTTTKALGKAEELGFPRARLIAPDVAPVRKIMEVKPKSLIVTPRGNKVLDFGQNLVGWLRIETDIPGTGQIVIRHAEVMEHGELGTRPLRTAQARTVITLGGQSVKGYEPRFSWYGFR